MTEEVVKMEPVESRLTFARKNDLTKLLKRLDKEADTMLDILATIAKDTSQDVKVRIDCAKAILDKRVSVSESVGKDQLSRLINEVRMKELQKSKVKTINIDNEEDHDTPQKAIFSNTVIFDVEKTAQDIPVVDMSKIQHI